MEAMFDLEQQNPLASNDPRVWDRLLDALGPPALIVVIEARMSRALAHRLRPEDVLQEALLQVWRGRERIEWRGLDAFRSYFLSVIDNRLRDLADHENALKRGGGAPRPLVSQLLAEDEGARGFLEGLQTTTPSRIAAVRERADAMHAALSSLPEGLRDVVRLRLFEEVPTDEAAERLGIGVSALKHRFRKGAELYRARLRAVLSGRNGIQGSNP